MIKVCFAKDLFLLAYTVLVFTFVVLFYICFDGVHTLVVVDIDTSRGVNRDLSAMSVEGGNCFVTVTRKLLAFINCYLSLYWFCLFQWSTSSDHKKQLFHDQ